MSDLPGVDFRALEIRLLLDLVSLELQRLDLAAGTAVPVHAAHPDLVEALADRLWPTHAVVSPDESRGEAMVHLLDLEEAALPHVFPARRLVIAFRNAWSHKRWTSGTWRGLPYPLLETRVAREHGIVAARGVPTPVALGRVAVAHAAHGARRHGVGFQLADRAVLSPSTSGLQRYLCPYGLIVGQRRC